MRLGEASGPGSAGGRSGFRLEDDRELRQRDAQPPARCRQALHPRRALADGGGDAGFVIADNGMFLCMVIAPVCYLAIRAGSQALMAAIHKAPEVTGA